VRLSDILHVEPHTTQPERYEERIRDIVLDFVLCDAQTTMPRLAVLFAQPGAARRTAFIDAALIGAGVPVLRLTRDEPLSVDALARQIAAALGLPVRSSPAAADRPARREQLNGASVISLPEIVRMAHTPVRYACGRCRRDVSPRTHRCPHCGATLAE
jgi:ribosomal protein S27AE